MKRQAMHRYCTIAAALVLSLGLSRAHAITVPNHSFETPDITLSGLPAFPIELIGAPGLPFPGIDASWRTAGPQVILGAELPIPVVPVIIFPNFPDGLPESPFVRITNLDGNQASGFLTLTGATIFQVLADTYDVGGVYSLTAGFANSIFTPPGEDSSLLMEFFYLDDALQQVLIGSHQVFEDDLVVTLLTDRTLTLPSVLAGDPWAGRQIGIRFVAQSGPGGPDGFINMDNVRVTSNLDAADIPEPATMLGCIVAAGAMIARRRRTA